MIHYMADDLLIFPPMQKDQSFEGRISHAGIVVTGNRVMLVITQTSRLLYPYGAYRDTDSRVEVELSFVEIEKLRNRLTVLT